MLSVIIPSYKSRYVSHTVQDIFEKATDEIEVIVLLDDYWPNPPIKDHKNLIVVHKGTTKGMRNGINMGASIAKGKYIAKCDDHCMFSEGFDEALSKDCQNDWISIPSRYSLDVEKWATRHAAVEYEYMTYPYVYLDKHRYGSGLVAKKWFGEFGINPKNMGYSEFYWKENQRRDIKIDDIMIFHGSCWFTTKKHFDEIGGLEETLFKTLYQEPQELSFKTWLSGGRVVVNKNAWYAHMFKGNNSLELPHSRGYDLDLTAMRETERFGTTLWMNDCWEGTTKPMKWLIEKFWPIPGWPKDWEQQKAIFEKRYLQKEMEYCKKKYKMGLK